MTARIFIVQSTYDEVGVPRVYYTLDRATEAITEHCLGGTNYNTMTPSVLTDWAATPHPDDDNVVLWHAQTIDGEPNDSWDVSVIETSIVP